MGRSNLMTKQTRFLKQPAHYSLPDHLARIGRTESFAAQCIALGLTHGEAHIKLSEELKRVIARHRTAEESEFENEVAQEALAAMLGESAA
jgi:hypothetical protein